MAMQEEEIRGNVGHILIRSKDALLGRKLFTEIDGWLDKSGWRNSSTLSLESTNEKTQVALIPGTFQSNGAKIVDLTRSSSFDGLRDELHRWFWEVL
jgi:hypothetical protein